MTEVELAPHAPTKDVSGTGAVVEGSAPVLITEQDVMFATAAVSPTPRTTGTRWWTAIGRLFTTAEAASGSNDDRRTPRVYPPRRHDFMDDAAMSREMYRL
ncbi:MAG: hypothetical protein QOH54_3239 [Mycobacterium sp.]|jgi:hypothetical protein|nr:hypothetical protein [Mycobacterium sp.]MDT5285780.1 hypothetical protein [Mycobacterium sp.]